MTERFPADAVLRRQPETLYRRVLDGLLLLAPGASEPLHISSPGDLIWILLELPSTVDELVNELATHYSVAPATVRADVKPLLCALRDVGALWLDEVPT